MSVRHKVGVSAAFTAALLYVFSQDAWIPSGSRTDCWTAHLLRVCFAWLRVSGAAIILTRPTIFCHWCSGRMWSNDQSYVVDA